MAACVVPMRQTLLILYSASPDLASAVVAWSSYDGASAVTSQAGDADTPPYPTVLDAMRDGWRVVQLASPSAATPGAEHRPAFLKWEVVLERWGAAP